MKIHNMSRRPIPGPYRKILYIYGAPQQLQKEKKKKKIKIFFFFFPPIFLMLLHSLREWISLNIYVTKTHDEIDGRKHNRLRMALKMNVGCLRLALEMNGRNIRLRMMLKINVGCLL